MYKSIKQHCMNIYIYIYIYISLAIAKTNPKPFITNRLYYCNSLLYNIASMDIRKIQYVQNFSAKFLTWSSRVSNYILILKYRHWLPVQNSIIFRFCTTAYQTLSSGIPSYLSFMLCLATKAQRTTFIWLSLVKTRSGTGPFVGCCPYSLEFTLWKC